LDHSATEKKNLIMQKGFTDCKVSKICAEGMGSVNNKKTGESDLFKGIILN